ncbi:MAG: hypothetical protein R2854_05000 [Caldilineaceae bacterium]
MDALCVPRRQRLDAADINAFYNDLSGQLSRAFSSITDPNQAGAQQTMAQVLYMAVYDGDSNVVQIDNQIVPGKPPARSRTRPSPSA